MHFIKLEKAYRSKKKMIWFQIVIIRPYVNGIKILNGIVLPFANFSTLKITFDISWQLSIPYSICRSRYFACAAFNFAKNRSFSTILLFVSLLIG